MPYIDRLGRDGIEPMIDFMGLAVSGCLDHPGKLNYIITKLIREYVNINGESYQHYNDAIGVLECIKQELYRRKIAPYENKKITENGDVF
jgi:hypothetical protein